jgi:16S rRNA (guanine527-N7)-methyltransferase
VLAIVCPELDVTCVDTVAKKAAFIQNSAITLKLPNLRGAHARVEELQAEPFDVVTSRAFSSLVDFVTLTRFHVKQPPGVWLAMKGKHPADELAALPADVGVFHVEPLEVPGLGAERCLVWMRKIGP